MPGRPAPPPQRPFRGTVIARIAGIEITVHGSWLIWLGLLSLIAWRFWVPEVVPNASPALAVALSIVMALPLSASIIVHELSHAAIARAYGLRVKRITLFLFGGVAQIEDPAPRPSAEFRIAVAGPLASLVLAAIFALASRLQHPEFTGLPGPWGTLAAFNLSVAVFNLLPAFPMDGGRILRSALWRGWANRARATRWAVTIGKGWALAFVAVGFGTFAAGTLGGGSSAGDLWIMVLGVFLFNAAGAAGRSEGGPTVEDERES